MANTGETVRDCNGEMHATEDCKRLHVSTVPEGEWR